MSERVRTGLVLGSSMDPGRLVRLAQLGEDLGFDENWIAEDYFFSGGVSAAGSVLQATHRATTGLGIVSGLVRHPAVLAMEIATMARMHPGRIRPGIGLGLPEWLGQMGLMPRSVVGALRESVVAVRRLLDGDELTQEGQFRFDHVRLTHTPGYRVPIDIGVAGPRMIEMCGEVADGLIIGLNASPAYVRWARERLAAGAAHAGRALDHRVTVFAFVSMSESAAVARARARNLVVTYVGLSGRNAVNDLYGISDEVVAMRDRGGIEGVQRDMPDKWIDDLAVVGTAEDCAAQIARYAEAGADAVILYPIDPHGASSSVRSIAADILPLLS